jgi:gas vesicle protein
MNGKSKFVAGLVLGAAAAAAIALFLQSKKGKEIMSDLKDEGSELLKKGKKFMEDLQHKAKDSASTE